MLNADKNSKTIKINLKSTQNQINFFISTRKKIKINQTKTFTVKIYLENHFQIIQINLEINHLIIPTTEDDHQTKEVHVISHKTDKVDQINEVISIETTIHDQVQIQNDQNIRLKPVPIHTLGIDTNQMIDQEVPRTIEIEIIPIIGIEATQTIQIKDIKIIYHEIILTTDQIIKVLLTTTNKKDHAIVHKIEI